MSYCAMWNQEHEWLEKEKLLLRKREAAVAAREEELHERLLRIVFIVVDPQGIYIYNTHTHIRVRLASKREQNLQEREKDLHKRLERVRWGLPQVLYSTSP